MSRKYEGFFVSEADSLEIWALAVLPEEGPYRGVVQIVHGMCEYKERYLDFMEYLAKNGYASVIHDHRGHGKSIRSKEDLGYMYGGGAKAMLQDIDTVNREIRKRFPDIPLILFGHSMGSLAVRAYTAKHDTCMDMLIVCGSPSKNEARPLGELIARVESRLFGPKHRSSLLETLSFGSYAMRFRKDKECTAWICSDKAVADAYRKSELCSFTFTDDAYLALFELMKHTYDIRKWNCTNPKLPILFVGGAQDPCIGNVRKFAKTLQFVRRAGYLDVKGKLYPGMRHEILNEKDKAAVYRDILVYMKRKGF